MLADVGPFTTMHNTGSSWPSNLPVREHLQDSSPIPATVASEAFEASAIGHDLPITDWIMWEGPCWSVAKNLPYLKPTTSFSGSELENGGAETPSIIANAEPYILDSACSPDMDKSSTDPIPDLMMQLEAELGSYG